VDEARLNTSRAILTAVLGLAALAIGRSLPTLCIGLAIASAGSFLYGLRIVLRLHPPLAKPDAKPDLSGGASVFRRWRPWSQRSHASAKLALRQSLPIWLAGLLSLMYFQGRHALHALHGGRR